MEENKIEEAFNNKFKSFTLQELGRDIYSTFLEMEYFILNYKDEAQTNENTSIRNLFIKDLINQTKFFREQLTNKTKITGNEEYILSDFNIESLELKEFNFTNDLATFKIEMIIKYKEYVKDGYKIVHGSDTNFLKEKLIFDVNGVISKLESNEITCHNCQNKINSKLQVCPNCGLLVSHKYDNLLITKIENEKIDDFNEAEFITKADHIFVMVLSAVMENDLSSVKHYLNDTVYGGYQTYIDYYIKHNMIKMYDELNVKSTDILNIRKDIDKTEIDVLITARYMDYFLDGDGNYLKGNNKSRIEVPFNITFTKLNKAKELKEARRCPSCNNVLDINASGECPYCGQIIDMSLYDYTITRMDLK